MTTGGRHKHNYVDPEVWARLREEIGYRNLTRYLGVTEAAIRMAEAKNRVLMSHYYVCLDRLSRYVHDSSLNSQARKCLITAPREIVPMEPSGFRSRLVVNVNMVTGMKTVEVIGEGKTVAEAYYALELDAVKAVVDILKDAIHGGS